MGKASDFVDGWVEDNIQGEPYVSEDGDDPRPAMYAQNCVAAAKEEGITLADIKEEIDDIEMHMAHAINASADREVERQSQKD